MRPLKTDLDQQHKVEIFALSEIFLNNMLYFYKRKVWQEYLVNCPLLKSRAQPTSPSFSIGTIRDCLHAVDDEAVPDICREYINPATRAKTSFLH